jgi:uncharacterized caspase-like protein
VLPRKSAGFTGVVAGRHLRMRSASLAHISIHINVAPTPHSRMCGPIDVIADSEDFARATMFAAWPKALGAAVLTIFALVAGTLSAQAERRVALVLGNSAYKHAVQLPNAQGDAEAMAGVLKSIGFEVVLGVNLGRDGMTEKMIEFGRLSGGADAALFFYAGHGIQLDGKNLLIPVDADLKSELDAKVRTLEIDSMLQHTMSDAKVKVVLLDACRDNPFAKQIQAAAPKTRSVAVGTGLADMRPGEGTLIAFATGPGQTALDGEGKHSPFTRALLAHLPTPNLELGQMMTHVRAQVSEETRKQQLPWANTNMTGLFYMKRDGAGPAVAALPSVAASPPASGFDPRVLELELWNAVKSSNNADDYKAYIEKYPAGTFADLARSRIASLSRPGATAAAPVASGEIKTAEATSATEDALGLDRDAWRDLQRRLSSLGYSTRGTDGRIGDGTRKGITAWQNARGYPATGYLNRLQRDALLQEAAPANRQNAKADEEEEEEKPRRRSTTSSSPSRPQQQGGGVPGVGGAAGEFVGGVVRGVIGKRLPF